MKNATTNHRFETAHLTADRSGATTAGPVQLRLLDDLAPSSRPSRFHLSRSTREMGLRHAAEIRRQIAERTATTGSEVAPIRPTRSIDAAA